MQHLWGLDRAGNFKKCMNVPWDKKSGLLADYSLIIILWMHYYTKYCYYLFSCQYHSSNRLYCCLPSGTEETIFSWSNVSCKQICRGCWLLLLKGHQQCLYHPGIGPAGIYTDSTSAAFYFGPLCTNRGQFCDVSFHFFYNLHLTTLG